MQTLNPSALVGGTRPAIALILLGLISLPDSTSAAAGIAPPALPDETHVSFGCAISTLAYIERFTRLHTGEQAIPLTVQPDNFSGPHTIALLTWRGTWWGRDEYSGVFPLELEVSVSPDIVQLRTRAESRLAPLAARHLKAGRIQAPSESPIAIRLPERRRLVRLAAALLPCESEIRHLRCNGEELPFLLFRYGTRIAVYDPAVGTVTAERTSVQDATVVEEVATHLGYRVERPSNPRPGNRRTDR